MGLDIVSYEKVELVPHHARDADECYEAGHVYAFVYDGFERSLRGLEGERCYQPSGEQMHFRAGSYSGYNAFREALSLAALGLPVGQGGRRRLSARPTPRPR